MTGDRKPLEDDTKSVRRPPEMDARNVRQVLERDAEAHGFCVVGITSAKSVGDTRDKLANFLDQGFHGSMSWLEEAFERRTNPNALWPEAKSIIMLAMNYGPDTDPLENLGNPKVGSISVYARHRDYHDLMKGRLKGIAGRLKAKTKHGVKVFVDTAPVMEKPLAASAGLGWQGKHTNLVSREHGSWLFLGSIFTSYEFEPDRPEVDHCGSCRACLDACPTNAFPAPYQLDARRCISYLTIEHAGPIPHEFRKAIGNRIYGCDDCLAACPWNKFAQISKEAKLVARDDLIAPSLASLLALDDEQFRTHFSRSPIKRIGRNQFIRNVLIAAGNSGDKELAGSVRQLANDEDEVVREAASWALGELG